MAPSHTRNIIQFTAKTKLFLSFMLLLLRLSVAQFDTYNFSVRKCGPGNIMNGSALERNLNVVLNSLVENVGNTGYNISWYGQNGDKMYGLVQCRGDLNASACRTCASRAGDRLRQICNGNGRRIMLGFSIGGAVLVVVLVGVVVIWGREVIKSGYKKQLPGYNISWYGQNGDKMYGLVQCRGDLNASACRTCASRAGDRLRQICNGTSGSIHVGLCFLRYSTQNFDSKLTSFGIFNGLCNESKSGNGGGFNWRIASLLTRLVEKTVSTKVLYSTLSDYGVYSLAECWRDLTMDRCSLCLNTIYTNLSVCPLGANEGTVLNSYCMIQFTGYKFYGDSVLWLSPPSGSSRATEGKGRRKMLGFSIGGAVLVVVLVGLVVIWGRDVIKPGYKKQLPGQYKKSSELSTAISKSKLHYKFQTLRTATKNFNLANKIGEGGFGSVYKGILPDGTEIAVKRLFSNKEQSVNEFLNEVNLISRVQHKNLIKLLGCSVDRPEKLLVYEYLPNKSLDLFLFDENMGNVLDWQRRFEIITGTASGLAYLHQESDIRIIHRDIKSSNILLDHNFKPKIADFGLVRYFAEDQTHISTRIVGTRGYMAPEYLVHGHLTEKVDVYGFGVLVLEIISGIKNTSPMHSYDIPSLLTMVWNNYLLGTISKIIDPNIQEKYLEEVLQVVHIALLCTQASATLRPSMSKVITFLTSKEPNLLKPTQPPFIHGIDSQSNTSATYNHSQSNTCTSVSPTSQIHQPYQTPLSPLPL